MAVVARFIHTFVLCGMLLSFTANAEQALTIQHAVQIALERDPLISAYQAQREAYQDQAIAEDSLPDPQIKLGLMNLPSDSLSTLR